MVTNSDRLVKIGFVVLALVFSMAFQSTNTRPALAADVADATHIHPVFAPGLHSIYSCGNLSSGHCYALEQADSSTNNVTGGNVNITVVPLQDNSSGFIDNEMWITDNSGYWVEVGQGTLNTSDYYFWADNRHNGGYNEHDLTTVPSGDIFTTADYSIAKSSTPGQYGVGIFTNNYENVSVSTNNDMLAYHMQLGSELAGPNNPGASAPYARFSNLAMSINGNLTYPNFYTAANDQPPYLYAGSTSFGITCC